MSKSSALILICIMAGGLIWLSGQSAPNQSGPTGTPGGLFWLVKGQLDYQETAQAAGAQAASARETERAASDQSNAYIAAQTAQAAEATQSAANESATQTAIAAQATASAEAVAGQTSTAQTWSIIGWTVTADVVRSTSEAGRTATADASHMRQTDIAADHLAITLRQAEDRQQAINQVMAWAPWLGFFLVAIIATGVIVIAAIKYWRAPQVIRPNKSGEMPLLWGNQSQWLLPSRSQVAAGRFSPAGVVVPNPLGDADAQERVIAREQILTMSIHAQPGATSGGEKRPEMMPESAPAQPGYRIIGPDEIPMLVDSDTLHVLDAQWKEVA